MNKFLNRKVRGEGGSKSAAPSIHRNRSNMDVLEEFARSWYQLESARRNMLRNMMYTWGDQWGDYVTDPDTKERITERELIMRQGKVPLKNNMIAPIVKNIEGQFRTSFSKSVCSNRDPNESKVGEMMSIAVEYVQDINNLSELDSQSLKFLEAGGFVAQRIEYGWNNYKQQNDVWVFGVNPMRMFFNTNIDDVRNWDLHLIGEIFDMTRDEIISLFAKSEEDRKWIESIYTEPSYYLNHEALTDQEKRYRDFYTPERSDLCRVILGWKLETRESYFCHDTLKGTFFYVGVDEINQIKQENDTRRMKALSAGVAEEDLLLIDYEFSYESYWYYRYMTPWGDVLQEGRSPYWHGQHNYVLHTYQLINGSVYPFTNDFIDQQRAINRTMTLIDFIRSASSKGVLVVDDSSFPEMRREDIIDQYVRYNGVLFCTLKEGKRTSDVVSQLQGAGTTSGDYQLLDIQLKLINEISGVNSAMQGRPTSSGTASSLYAQQVQNSSLNLKGLLDSFNAFRRERDTKMMKTIQQYYTSKRYIDLSGTDYSEESKYYDPDKIQNAELDLKITDGGNSPTYQMVVNDFLMELFKNNAIDVKQFLENSSLPFATKILESIKRNEEEAARNQQMSGIDPNVMAQAPGVNPALIRKMNDNSNASPQDGIVMQA